MSLQSSEAAAGKPFRCRTHLRVTGLAGVSGFFSLRSTKCMQLVSELPKSGPPPGGGGGGFFPPAWAGFFFFLGPPPPPPQNKKKKKPENRPQAVAPGMGSPCAAFKPAARQHPATTEVRQYAGGASASATPGNQLWQPC